MKNFDNYKPKGFQAYYLLTMILSIILFFYNLALGLIATLVTIYIAFVNGK